MAEYYKITNNGTQCRRDSSIMHRFTINSSPLMTEDITINNRLEVKKLIVKV